MNISHFPMALLCTYVLIIFTNQLLRRFSNARALKRDELLVVLAMGLVGAAVPAYGLTSFFLGMISVPYYRATPENQWADLVHPHLPSWLTPTNEGDAMRWLFEGLPQGYDIPWDVWTVPLFWWLSLIVAITVGCVAVATILRKQWSENERVAYPMLVPTVTLADAADTDSEVNVFAKRLFWVAFWLIFTIKGWNIISYFIPGFPRIWLGQQWLFFARYFPPQHTGVNFFTIGFAYFANIDLLFSIVVFHLVYMNEIALSRRIGLAITAKTGPGDPVSGLQSAGAFIALVFWTFWTARHHLAEVWRKAFRDDEKVDDSNELMSYRTALISFFVSLVFIALWIRSMGLEWRMTIPMTLGLFIAYIGLARVIAETGVVYMSMPISEAGITDLFFHPTDYSAGARTSITLFSAIRTQGKAMFMVPLVHAAKLGDMLRGAPRRLLGAIVATLVVGVGANILYTLYLSYTYGAFNFGDLPFTAYPPRVYDALVVQVKEAPLMKPERYVLVGAGMALFSVMSVLRYRFTWWPLNPMGMIVPVGHAMHSTMSIFIAWAAKTMILRIGGIQLYNRCRPFFVGMLAGYAMAIFFSFLVDFIWFPEAGHHMHSW
jgi:hypothetical protein